MPNTGRITSPEQLNDYIRVTTPGAWIILSSILIFLAGFLFWILAGSLEISFSSYVYTYGEKTLSFISPDDASKLKSGMTVRISDSGLHGTVEKVASATTPYPEILKLVGESNALMMGINDSDKLIQVTMHIDNAPQKVSQAIYVIDTVKPALFLLK